MSIIAETITNNRATGQPNANDGAEKSGPTTLETALQTAAAGIPVLPVRAGGKTPLIENWQRNATTDPATIRNWWDQWPNANLGALMGGDAGRVMLEIEGHARPQMPRIIQWFKTNGHWDLFKRVTRGWAEESPSGGLHWIFTGHHAGNTRLAVATSGQTLTETRGDGGQTVLAPSTLETGGEPVGEWKRLHGGPDTMARLTAAEAQIMLDGFASINEALPVTRIRTTSTRDPNLPARPLDDYAAHNRLEDLLPTWGWTRGKDGIDREGAFTEWTRPGKDPREGHSAYQRDQTLIVWSTNAGLDLAGRAEKGFNAYQLHAIYDHGGDFGEAARAARQHGYGGTYDGIEIIDVTRPQPLSDTDEPTTTTTTATADGWNPVDLTNYLTGDGPTGPQPEHLIANDGQPTFAPSTNNTIVGDPESGKTWVLLAAGAEQLHAGGKFAFIDLDHNGPAATIARLRALAVPDSIIGDRNRFLYVDPEDSGDLDTTVDALISRNVNLVGIDSVGELVPLYGASSNSPDEFTAVNRNVNARLARAGACVIGVDHLAKGEESRKQGATGTLAKKRAIDGVMLRCTLATPYAPGKGGSSHLTIEKDRHGVLRAARHNGERRPLVGTFQLYAQPYGGRAWTLLAPKQGANPVDEPDEADKAAISALDPAPTTVKEARERLGWRMDRAAQAMRWLRRNPPKQLPITKHYPVTGNAGEEATNPPVTTPVTHKPNKEIPLK